MSLSLNNFVRCSIHTTTQPTFVHVQFEHKLWNNKPSRRGVKMEIRSPSVKKISFVTGNQMKIEELNKILEDIGTIQVEAIDLDLQELQDNPETITRGKCLAAASQISGPVLVEDTSLCFNALNGLPGPYVKWFLQGAGCTGLYKMLEGFPDKKAYAQTTLGYIPETGADPLIFVGKCHGEIVSPRGSQGGWDPVFQPNGHNKTFGEMTKEEKNAISHRSNALQQLKEFLKQENGAS